MKSFFVQTLDNIIINSKQSNLYWLKNVFVFLFSSNGDQIYCTKNNQSRCCNQTYKIGIFWHEDDNEQQQTHKINVLREHPKPSFVFKYTRLYQLKSFSLHLNTFKIVEIIIIISIIIMIIIINIIINIIIAVILLIIIIIIAIIIILLNMVLIVVTLLIDTV